MEFHGSRADDLDSGTNPRDRGNYSAIALNASDPTRPGFMFVNGTEFVWKQYSDGAWGASSSDEGSSGVAVSVGLKKLWCVWGAFMVYYLLL